MRIKNGMGISFNRNIVECKLFFARFCTADRFVLIETLWNVNLKEDVLADVTDEF